MTGASPLIIIRRERYNSRFAFRRKFDRISRPLSLSLSPPFERVQPDTRACKNPLFPLPPCPRFIRCKTMNILNRGEKWILPAARIRPIFPVKNQRRERVARHFVEYVHGNVLALLLIQPCASVANNVSRGKFSLSLSLFLLSRFNLISQGRHVFITPLFDRANRRSA